MSRNPESQNHVPGLIEAQNLASLGKKLKQKNERIVFTTGAYDLLHSGHARFLAEARTYGDALVVGVSSNQSRKARKGPGHPMLDEKIRAEALTFLKPVDFVTIVDDRDLSPLLGKLAPDVFYTIKEDWEEGVRRRKERTTLKKLGSRIMEAEKVEPFISSSMMVEEIARRRLLQVMGELFSQVSGKEELPIELDTGPRTVPIGANLFSQTLDLGSQKPKSLLGFKYMGEIVEKENLGTLGEKLREEGRKVSFVSGSYDLLHVGHARFIEEAKSWGDVLVVGTPSNQSLRGLKGPGRPLVDENSRAELLCYLKPVDYVTIFSEDTVYQTLKALKPQVFQTVDEAWNRGLEKSPEYKLVTDCGGEVKLVKRQSPFLSSSALISRAAGLKVRELFKKALEQSENLEAIGEDWSSYEQET